MNALKRALAAIGLESASPGANTPGKAAARPAFAAAGRRPLWLAYGLPFVTTAVTLWVVEAAGPDVPAKTPAIIFLFPIILCAYVGGLAPGLLATVLSTVATFYFVLPPTRTWHVTNPVDNIKWITLAAVGTLISFLMAHKERPRPEQAAQPVGSLLVSTERKVRTGFAVLLACLIAIAAVSYPALVRLREDTAWVDHSYQVIATLRLLISSTTDAETNVRGFIITGRAEFLEPYHSALQRVNYALSEVRRLTKDNPEQQRRLDALEPLVAERLAALKAGVERGRQAFSLAQGSVWSGKGSQLQERIRSAVAEMEATEQALLAKREALEQRASAVMKIEIVGGSALAVLIVAAALWMIGEAFAASRGAETALQESRDQLEIRVKERTSALVESNELVRASEQRLRRFYESGLLGVIYWNINGEITDANGKFLEMVGYDREDLKAGRVDWTTITPPEYRYLDERSVEELKTTGVNKAPFEKEYTRRDGTRVPIVVAGAMLDEARSNGVAFVLDITERKRAEEALRESESRERARAAEFEALMEAAPVGIFKSGDAECRWMSGNRAAYDLLRRPRGSNLSKSGPEGQAPVNFRAMKDGKEIPLSELPMQIAAATGQAVRDHEMDFIFEDGVTVNILGNVVPLLDESGRPRGSVGTFLDITERKRTEEALRRSEADLREAQRIAQVGSWTWEVASDTVTWSEEIYRIFSRDPKLPAPSVAESTKLFTPESWARLSAAQQETLERGTPYILDLEVVRPDGTRGWMTARGEAERDGSGQVTKLRGTTQDITERKNAEQALARRTQELERSNADLAQFAYVASHDLKEPLRAVSGCVGLLKRHYEGKLDERAGEYMTHIVDGSVRMESLIDGLLAFSRVGTQGRELRPVECAKALGTALQNLATTIQESGAVVTQDPLPAVNGDLPQLVSLFQNLIGNALKFRKEAPPRIHVSAERNGASWRFSVRDNGIGIAPQYFERIFGVFQRLHTRSQYPGTGIGLALCKKIVERHGGRIWVESVPGEGATFYFSLLDAQTDYQQHERNFHA